MNCRDRAGQALHVAARGLCACFAVLFVLAHLAVGPVSTAARRRSPRTWAPIAIAAVDLVIVTVLVARGTRRAAWCSCSVRCRCSWRRGGCARWSARSSARWPTPATVVPICSAMGFAFVLRLTECDQHLVGC